MEDQRQVMVYDDLGAQVLNVAEGVFSAPYWYKSPFSIRWTILNEYLRRYLWIRGSVGVRQISCLGLLEDSQELRDLMRGETEVTLGEDEDWYEIHIRENVDGLLLDVRAAVPVVSCALCPVSEPRVENWTNPYPHHFL